LEGKLKKFYCDEVEEVFVHEFHYFKLVHSNNRKLLVLIFMGQM
jgi:hypothetical protein